MNPNDPAVVSHMSLLQAIITRLAGNSAQCKTWCLTLVSALIAFAGAAHSVGAIELSILPIVMFLLLDAAYLGNEKEYRDLFGEVRAKLRTGDYCNNDLFKMEAKLTSEAFLESLKSWAIYIFYYPLIGIYIIVICNPGLAKALASVR